MTHASTPRVSDRHTIDAMLTVLPLVRTLFNRCFKSGARVTRIASAA